jgi:hypothetical protein
MYKWAGMEPITEAGRALFQELETLKRTARASFPKNVWGKLDVRRFARSLGSGRNKAVDSRFENAWIDHQFGDPLPEGMKIWRDAEGNELALVDTNQSPPQIVFVQQSDPEGPLIEWKDLHAKGLLRLRMPLAGGEP